MNWSEYVTKNTSVGQDYKLKPVYLACQKVGHEFNNENLQGAYNKELVNYCQPSSVKTMGAKGLYFKYELCPELKEAELAPKHAEGVKSYCQKTNGYTAGKKGLPYNNICPEDLVTGFVSEFDRGRREYLINEISIIQRKVDEIDYRLQRSYGERTHTYNNLVLHGHYNSSYLNYVNKTQGHLNSNNYYHQWDAMRHRMYSIDNDIRVMQFYKRDFRLKIEKLKAELKKADGLVDSK